MNPGPWIRIALAIALLVALPFASALLGRASLARVQRANARLEAEWDALEEARRTAESERDFLTARQREISLRRVEAARPGSSDLADDPWMDPPAALPHWNPASPHIWLPKDAFPLVGMLPWLLGSHGELHPGVAEALCLSDPEREALDAELRGILEGLHASEVDAATVRVDAPASPGDPTTVTVDVPGNAANPSPFRAAFEAALTSRLGPQRAALLLEAAAGWVDRHFNDGPEVNKSYAVTRYLDGRQQVQIREGNSFMSMGGPATDLTSMVPSHLLPLFEALPPVPSPSDPSDSSAAPQSSIPDSKVETSD